MKTLFSFMVEKETINKIKQIPGITVAEFARNALEYYLNNKTERYLGYHKRLETVLYELQFGFPIAIADYHNILNKLNGFYSCGGNQIICLSNEEISLFAFCAAELLQLEFPNKNISQHPVRYFVDYFCSDFKEPDILSKVNFIEFVSYLHFESEHSRFTPLGIIRIIEVFLRDILNLDHQQIALQYLSKIDSILIKMAVHLLIDDDGKNFSGFQDILKRDEKLKTSIKITDQEMEEYEVSFTDDNFTFHGSLYSLDRVVGRFYVEVKDPNLGYSTMSLPQWVELVHYLKDDSYKPTRFLFVKSRNDFMMEWRYPFAIGDIDKFKKFIYSLLENPEYKRLMDKIYKINNIKV